MLKLVRSGVACLVLAAGGCVQLDTFACAQSSECVHEGLPGTCEAAGVCSFPDTSCPSGKKYGEFAGEQAGQCVGVGATSGPPTTGTATGTDASDPTTTPDSTSTTTTTTTVDPDTTVDPSQVSVTTTDPTVTTVTTVEPTTDSSTGGPVCVGLGESCADAPCCSPCMTCEAGVCGAAAPEAGPTACGGGCFVCGADGECATQPEMTGCKTNCAEVVWQAKVVGAQTGCYSYPSVELDSTCDAAGQCIPPAVAACPDPTLMPGSELQIVLCDTACLGDAAASLCVQGAPAAAVDLASYCVVNSESAACTDVCVLDANMMPAVDDAVCDAAGVCAHSLETCMGGLKCDEVNTECPDKCNEDADCVSGNCQGIKCQ
jgi:hypothetical protein